MNRSFAAGAEPHVYSRRVLAPGFWLLNSKKKPRACTARGLASHPTNSASRLTAGLTQASDLRLNLGITLLLKRGQRLLLFGR